MQIVSNKVIIVEEPNGVFPGLLELIKNEFHDFLLINVNTMNDMATLINSALVIICMPILESCYLDLIKSIRKNSWVPIIVLSESEHFSDKILSLESGADEYFETPFTPSELLIKARVLVNRYLKSFDAIIDEEISITNFYINAKSRSVQIDGHEVTLTAKEFDLLYLLATHRGQVFTDSQIYRYVWGDDYSDINHNIETSIWRIRKKIESNPKAPAFIQTVRGVGYKFNEKL